MANLYEPIMPSKTLLVKNILNLDTSCYEPISYDSGVKLESVPYLFQRIDPANVDLEKGSEITFKA